MQLSLAFGSRITPGAAALCSERLQAVLLAARQTGFYSRRLKTGLFRLDAAEALASLPPVTLRMFFDNREQFTNASVRPASQSMDRVQALPDGWRARLGFPAQAIAGPKGELAQLAGDSGVRPARFRGARRVIAYTKLGDPLLSNEHRDRMWRAFELPVFEQLRGLDGELLGAECEAHDGLHLETESAIFEILEGELLVTSLLDLRYPIMRLRTSLCGTIDRRACACGAASARFLPAAAAVPMRKPPASEHQVRPAVRRASGS